MKSIQNILMLIVIISSLTWAVSIKTWKKNYATNKDIWIKVENKPNNNKEWVVGVYPLGSSNTQANSIRWKWAKDTSDAIDPGDWYKFLNLADGDYEARFFLNNKDGIEDSIAFSVGGRVEKQSNDKIKKRNTDNKIKRPRVGRSSIDNVYGTEIKMLNKSDAYISNYPKVQSWNRVYNANTLEESPITRGLNRDDAFAKVCSPNSSDFRWSNTNSNTFYVLNNKQRFIEGKIIGIPILNQTTT
jgi:hypothetical protein